MSEDLWGELPDAANIRTPRAILLEQAEILTTKTKGLLVGNLGQSTSGNQFHHNLAITAPSLSYSYVILSASHTITLYPVKVNDLSLGTGEMCSDENTFMTAVQKVLTSAPVRNVITGLLAQINANAAQKA